MTNLPEKEQIRQAVNEYCLAKAISKNQFATQVGVSSATLSKIEHHKWDDIDERIWRKVWLKVSEATKAGTFNTADFARTENACRRAQNNHLMVGLIADTGLGKTTALSSFYLSGKNVFYVSYEKSMKPKQFFAALLKDMGTPFEGTIHEMLNRIAEELNTLENPLVIIDEAGKLNQTAILYLQVLRDKTDKNSGILLAGMPYFKTYLEKFAYKEKEGYSEFLRRVNLWQTLDGLSRAEITFICQQNGIEAEMIKSMYPHKRFGDLQNAILLHQIENAE